LSPWAGRWPPYHDLDGATSGEFGVGGARATGGDIAMGPVTVTGTSSPLVMATKVRVKPSPPSTIGARRISAKGAAVNTPSAMQSSNSVAVRLSLKPQGASSTRKGEGGRRQRVATRDAPARIVNRAFCHGLKLVPAVCDSGRQDYGPYVRGDHRQKHCGI